MHPVVRIVTFIVFAACVARAQPGGLVLAAGVSAAALLATHASAALLGARLWRLRWLFASLLVVYLGFTPGPALWPALGAWSPSVSGVIGGLERCAVLALLVVAAHVLLETTARGELIDALHRLMRPLRQVGLEPQRVAVRIVLAMEMVPRLEPLVRERARALASGPGRVTARIGQAAATLYAGVLSRAAEPEPDVVEIVDAGTARVREWLLPVVLGAAFALV